jgi:proline dehydrogenase
MKLMSEFFDLIYDVALNSRNEILTNDEEYKELMVRINKLSDEYKQLDLTQEQRQVIDQMIQVEDMLNEKEMQAIYKKGILNCAEILKDLKLLK